MVIDIDISDLPNTYLDVPSFNTKYGKEYDNSFSLIHFNCRRLHRNFDNLALLLNEIKHKFKIIGLTETWLHSSSFIDAFQFDGYNFLHSDRVNRRGGGTGLYIHKSLQHKFRSDLSVTCNSFESTFIEFESVKCKKTVIGVIYRPPGQNVDELINYHVF